MSGYSSRLYKLEKAMKPCKPEFWHRIIQDIGETQEEAIAEYEAKNGRIGKNENTLIRRIVAPNPDRFK